MPFETGNQLAKGQGRKGYEFEKETLERMQRVYNKDLTIIERLQDQEVISPVDREKLQISQARVLKYADKLHASKSDLTSDGKQIVISISPVIAKKHGISTNESSGDNSTGQTPI